MRIFVTRSQNRSVCVFHPFYSMPFVGLLLAIYFGMMSFAHAGEREDRSCGFYLSSFAPGLKSFNFMSDVEEAKQIFSVGHNCGHFCGALVAHLLNSSDKDHAPDQILKKTYEVAGWLKSQSRKMGWGHKVKIQAQSKVEPADFISLGDQTVIILNLAPASEDVNVRENLIVMSGNKSNLIVIDPYAKGALSSYMIQKDSFGFYWIAKTDEADLFSFRYRVTGATKISLEQRLIQGPPTLDTKAYAKIESVLQKLFELAQVLNAGQIETQVEVIVPSLGYLKTFQGWVLNGLGRFDVEMASSLFEGVFYVQDILKWAKNNKYYLIKQGVLTSNDLDQLVLLEKSIISIQRGE